MARGVVSPRVGAERGTVERTWLAGKFAVVIDDLAACIAASDHPARLTGTVSFGPLTERATISDGSLHLYVPDSETGTKQIRYRATFPGGGGKRYRLEATKFIRPGRATVREQVTAYARILSADGTTAEEPTVVAAGVLVFRLRDLPAFLWSMRVAGASRLAGIRHFVTFARRELTTPIATAPVRG